MTTHSYHLCFCFARTDIWIILMVIVESSCNLIDLLEVSPGRVFSPYCCSYCCLLPQVQIGSPDLHKCHSMQTAGVVKSPLRKVQEAWKYGQPPFHEQSRAHSRAIEASLEQSKVYSHTFDRPTGWSKVELKLSTVLVLKQKITDTQIF